MKYVTKFVRNDDFIQFAVDEQGKEVVTASDPSIIQLYNSFVERENNEEWVEGVGDFFADIDGLEGEAGFTRTTMRVE